MSSTDFLFSIRKLLAWLVTFLSALLPQHLMTQLSEADIPLATYVSSQPYARTAAPPKNLGRAAVPPPSTVDNAEKPTPTPKDKVVVTQASPTEN